ncbi:DUF2341 domain-containing protein [Planctomycetota bacterium]
MSRRSNRSWTRAIAMLVIWLQFFIATSDVSILNAATYDYDFANSGDYVFNAGEIEFVGGAARLRLQNLADTDNSAGTFDGAHNNTQWSVDHIELAAAQVSGDYTSQPIDANAIASWDQISFTAVTPGNAIPWYDTDWTYRQTITITNNDLAVSLSEFQVLLDINSAGLIGGGQMLADGADIRFTGTDGTTILDHWVESGINTANTQIWVQIDSLPANSSIDIFMYYDNAGAADASDEFETFSYGTPQPIWYAVSDDAALFNCDFASFRDGNTIEGPTTTLNLDKGDVGQIPAAELTTTTAIKCTAPLAACPAYGFGDGGGHYLPISAAGMQFVYGINRGDNATFDVYSPFGTATVNLYRGSALTLMDTMVINQGQHSESAGDYTAQSVIISSDLPVLVYYEDEAGNNDSIPFLPAATDWFGVPGTQFSYAALNDGTVVTIRDSGGATPVNGVTRNSGDMTTITGLTNYGNNAAFHMSATDLVGGYQCADGDGGDASSFLPVSMLGKEYIIPQQADYVAIACLEPNTTVTALDSNDAIVAGPLTSGAQAQPFPNKIRFAGPIPAGTRFVSDKPIHAYFEGMNTASDCETIIFPPKMNRKYHYPEPTTGGLNADEDEYLETYAKFQVRSGNVLPLGDAFTGPDGTGATYYETGAGEALNISDGRYLEYRLYLTTSNAAVSPEVSVVNIACSFYLATEPVLQPAASLAVPALRYWTGFAETAIKNGGEINYQLSDDNGFSWQYYTGAAWSPVGGATDYNTAAVINGNISSFPRSARRITFKAFLVSDGSQLVSLDNIEFTYSENDPPDGGFAVEDIIPATEISQSDDGSGIITIGFKVTDNEGDFVTLSNFEYSTDGGFSFNPPAAGDSSLALGATWPDNSGAQFASGLTFPGSAPHSFTFNTQHADIAGMAGVDQNDVQVQFMLGDAFDPSPDPVISESFRVDNDIPNLPAIVLSNPVSPSGDATPELSGTADPNITVLIFEGVAQVGSGLSDGAGNWTITTSTLSAGNHTLTARARDDAGNESADSADFDYTNNDPPRSGYSLPNVIPANQVVQAKDGSGQITINFKIIDGDLQNCDLHTFEYSIDDGLIFNPPANGDLSGALSPGWDDNGGGGYPSGTNFSNAVVHSFILDTRHADLAGLVDVDQNDVQVRFMVFDGINDSAIETTSESFRVDNVVPPAPAIVTADPVSPTHETRPTFTGTAEINSSIDIYTGPAKVGSGLTNGLGDWSVTLSSSLADGIHGITAKSIDAFGNESVASAPMPYEIDTSVPAQPVITNIRPPSPSKDPTPTIDGTAEAERAVKILDNGSTVVGTGVVNAVGIFSVTLTIALSEGTHLITAVASGITGDSEPSNYVIYTVDLTAPAAPIIDGSSPAGPSTNQSPIFRGFAEAGSEVYLYEGVALIGEGKADGLGRWNILGGPLAEGIHFVQAMSKDAAGNESLLSGVFTYEVDFEVFEITEALILDANRDGNIDSARLTFSKDIDDASVVNFGFSLDGEAAHVITGIPGDNQLELFLNAGPLNGTEAKALTYVTPPGYIRSVTGRTLATIGSDDLVETDAADPIFLGYLFADNDVNGFIDTITWTFSEDLDPATMQNADVAVFDADGVTDLMAGGVLSISAEKLVLLTTNDKGSLGAPKYLLRDNGDYVYLSDMAGNWIEEMGSNTAPVAEVASNFAQYPGRVSLQGSGSDPDGNEITFLWEQVGGPVDITLEDANTTSASFVGLKDGLYSFTLTITDSFGVASASAFLSMTVFNLAPTASAGPDFAINRDIAANVQLDGSLSADTNSVAGNSDIAGYQWFQIGGPEQVILNNPDNPKPDFVPAGLATGIYIFLLVVTDDNGSSANDVINVILNSNTGVLPKADAGIDLIYPAGFEVVLTGHESSAPNSAIETFNWTQLSGPPVILTGDAGNPRRWFTPLVEAIYEFELSVDNSEGLLSQPDRMTVTVYGWQNSPPQANAGDDQVVALFDLVQLDGRFSSDNDDENLSYEWEQISGTKMTLSNQVSPTPNFFALQPGFYQFKLIVTDEQMQHSNPDLVNIIVNSNALGVPVADAGADITGTTGVPVLLDGSASHDPDDDDLGFRWTQIAGPIVSLNDPTSNTPQFTPVLSRVYEFELRVNDGRFISIPDRLYVIIDGANKVPTAQLMEASIEGEVGSMVFLDGTDSFDPAGDADPGGGDITNSFDGLLFSWEQSSGPLAELEDPTSAISSFVPEMPGTYHFLLRVDDGADRSVPALMEVIIEEKPGTARPAGSGGSGGGSGCFIATATYGSAMAPAVIVFRDYRDRFLVDNRAGNFLVQKYYQYSPPLASFIAKHSWAKCLSNVILLPLLVYAWIMISTGMLAKIFICTILASLTYLWLRRRRMKLSKKPVNPGV